MGKLRIKEVKWFTIAHDVSIDMGCDPRSVLYQVLEYLLEIKLKIKSLAPLWPAIPDLIEPLYKNLIQ